MVWGGELMVKNCSKLTKDDLEAALAKLDEEDRERIARMAANLQEDIRKMSRGKILFGPMSALELIARVGVFHKKKIKKIKN
jgi:hypothetical protein